MPATWSERRGAVPARILSVRDAVREGRDELAGEEPMEIRVTGPGGDPTALAVVMRTPGHDFELAAGFLVGEGLVAPSDIVAIAYCELPAEEQHYNVVTVRSAVPIDPDAARAVATSASCGICGRASLDRVVVACEPPGPGPVVARSTVASLPARLREAQPLFARTGGLHAAALFDAGGGLVEAREDVGRHNAVDKLVGRAALDGGLPLREAVLMVSGRASFEIVQKAAVAGVPVVCAVSAPSSLAVRSARELGTTLVGFLRDDGFTVYSGPARLDLDA